MSGKLALVRYRGRRSDREFVTPVQHVPFDDGLVILAGRLKSKFWWRNFIVRRALDILVAGRWRKASAHVARGPDEREQATRMLAAYVDQSPSARRASTVSTRGIRAPFGRVFANE